jgi:hypothetical protein
MKLVLFMGLFSFLQSLLGASAAPTAPKQAEEPWHDFTVSITSYETNADGSQVLELSMKENGKSLRYKAVLSATWRNKKMGPLDAHVGTVEFVSLGSDSDTFARFIDETYGTKQGIQRARAKSSFSAITLGGNPKALEDGPVKIKLFFEPDDEKQYAELYFNIDLKNKKAEINEKDPDYRTNVALAFGQK